MPRPAPIARPAQRLLVAALLLALAVAAGARALYKVVGPDGSVTYTDRPPADASAPRHHARPPRRRHRGGRRRPLPAELRAGDAALPGHAVHRRRLRALRRRARQLLQQRGVPYTETPWSTSEDDAAALERTVGARTVPALTIGAQALRGLAADRLERLPRRRRLPARVASAAQAGRPRRRRWSAAPARRAGRRRRRAGRRRPPGAGRPDRSRAAGGIRL
ncbi:MAG: DUF4124 domain-containing protein [Comamonadaceae bacterium]|nr:DUF4124 domain-containing protein [Comamonadaceae bacterium]